MICRDAAFVAERRRRFLVVFGLAFGVGPQRRQPRAGAFQRFELGGQALCQLRQLGRRAVVLARQILNAAQALFDLVETLRIDIERIHVVAQRVDRLLGLDTRTGDQLQHRREAVVDLGEVADQALCAAQLIHGRAFLGLVERGERALTVADQAFGAGQAAMLGFEGLEFVRAEIESVEFVHLITQQVDTHVARVVDLLDARDFFTRCPQCVGGLGDRGERVGVFAVLVEQGALGAAT